ncbi:MAG: toll/interleukin-1 receptor domain-containing protein [Chloroflexi bacterium]|nr:toll/interleukin-1 receptor domain-containing protein [Chloroflexota bacterium]MDL1882418.1 toll/interleukin-1 receptor domain-containing protein [Anaerolineae bacterium CFX8]
MSHIFVCYSRVDRAITEQLAGLLRKAYNHVWYDDNLHGGEEWWTEILKEIARCHHFIFLMSDESIGSEWCRRELDEARRLTKHVLPVLVRARTLIPAELQKLQRIDMSSGITVENLNALYAALIRAVNDDQSSISRQKQRAADRRALERLWPFIHGSYIEALCDQVQCGKLDWELYTSHIAKYLDLRAKTRDRFSNLILEEVFESFDDALIRLDGQLGWTYELRENDGRSYMMQPEKAMEDSYWFEKYNRLVRRSTDVLMRHIGLVETIKTILPDFDVQKEE